MLAEKTTPVQVTRAAAVLESLERIRAVVARGASRESLEDVKAVVTDLAKRTELFPREQFPLGPNGAAFVYYLAQDPDGGFAIYASAGAPGKSQPPHNHTTWAVISGVYGEEHNVLFRRTDNGSDAGQGALEQVGELTVRRGNAVSLMPNDFHTIRVIGDEYSLHLHAYGRSLEQLPERIRFESPSGGTFKTFPANPNITSPRIFPRELKSLLHSGCELSILDVRTEAQYARGHLLFACSVPLDAFEQRLSKLVPQKSACIVLCDGGGGEVEGAAAVVRRLGYKNVSVLAGGTEAWSAEGYELFAGFNVPSKAFGEVVEQRRATPHISAVELRQMLDEQQPLIVLDSRPPEEFANMSIPTALCCPGGELVYRIFDAAEPGTLVVVNCAGRTRSIIGAQSLIETGIPNRVVALQNGTMGWQLAGFPLDRGATRRLSEPGAEGSARAREAAERVARRYNVKTLTLRELREFECSREKRTLYAFDVRTREEYRKGHLAGARWAPGGQLVQATDVYVGVRNARIVLIDSDGVRARMTAAWLVQMGAGDVYVLDDARAADAFTETGDEAGWMPEFGSARNKPYDSPEKMESYLSWEVGLVEQIRRDGDAPFAAMLDK